ncbi:hypothetical protein CR513_17489, partial [Mucuna pruriens]
MSAGKKSSEKIVRDSQLPSIVNLSRESWQGLVGIFIFGQETTCKRGKAPVTAWHSHFSHSSIEENCNVSKDVKEEELLP